jgi:hypothetical protein
MQTFLPYQDFFKSSAVLDKIRLNSQINEALILIRSLTGVYPRNRRGESGWEGHTIAKMWKGCELQLARFGFAMADEFYKRAASKDIETFNKAKDRRTVMENLIAEMEARDFPDETPSLVGDEGFHSAFRALLLYKDIQATTYRKWKQGEYPDHAVTRNLLPRKSSWKRASYIAVWDFFGRPDPVWYGQFGWTEDPDDMRVFYTEDRIPQMQKEAQRKKEKPMLPFLMKKI